MERTNRVMCAALYLGSPYTSYAFSFKSHEKDIYACTNWSTKQTKPSYHTLSTLLLDNRGRVVSFGYDAENHYNEMPEDELDKYDLFRDFPSVLCDKENIDEFTMIQSVSGREVAAIDLFSNAFAYLKDHLKDNIITSYGNFMDVVTRWVVILPNKNDYSVNQFIRNAAEKACLTPSVNSSNLLLAHESEAIASYCRHFGKNHDIHFYPGMKYIMIHTGDTKIDITAHEVLPTGHYEEITKPIQIHSCKEEIKEKFEMLLANTIGQKCLSEFKMKSFSLWQKTLDFFHNSTALDVLDHFTKVISVSGRSFSAMKVFAMALNYLKNHLMAALMKQLNSPPCNSMIKWVLTIPSLWDDSAKDFMRKAAKEAGLIRTVNSKQLLLVLEAEAASVYCHYKFKDKESFRIGTRYTLIDAGGGTADIATHEVLNENNLKEILPSTGVKGGGHQVNSKFEELLSQQDVLGQKLISRYKDQYPSHWLTFLNNFENGKRSVNISCDNKIRIPFQPSMKAMLKAEKRTLEDITAPGVSFKSGALCIEGQSTKKLFEPVVDSIIRHLKQRDYLINIYNIEYFFVVGGFGENQLFINRLETEFGDKIKVLKPDSSGHSVLVGAVLYGHDPKSIERLYPYRIRRRRVLISSN